MKSEPTNREVAERFGVSIRTVSKLRGRSRHWWREQRRERQETVARLRDTGMTWKEIGASLGITEGAARAAGKRARGMWADGRPAPTDRDPNTGDLFASA